MMEIGPEPEQMIECDVIPRRRCCELAELPGILVEGEIQTGYGGETAGGFHVEGEKTRNNKKLFKKRGKINRGKRRRGNC